MATTVAESAADICGAVAFPVGGIPTQTRADGGAKTAWQTDYLDGQFWQAEHRSPPTAPHLT